MNQGGLVGVKDPPCDQIAVKKKGIGQIVKPCLNARCFRKVLGKRPRTGGVSLSDLYLYGVVTRASIFRSVVASALGIIVSHYD